MKRALAVFLAAIAASTLFITRAAAASDPGDSSQRSQNFDRILSPDKPLSMEEIQRLPAERAAQLSAFGAGFTYLRCWFRIQSGMTTPATDYEWARDSNGDYYKLMGEWWGDGFFEWKNMFYTRVPQSELEKICRATLRAQRKPDAVALLAASNNAASRFNYTIWSLDSPSQTGFNKVVAFGDSLTDTQNMLNASLGNLPNKQSWFLGRFSNSNVWVERLSRSLNLPMYNWATGGAAVNTHYQIPGLQKQVESFIEYMKKATNYDPKWTQFVVWVGANDILTYKDSVNDVIGGEWEALRKLIDFGARNIVVLNLPDISKTPVFKWKSAAEQVRVRKEVGEYNTGLVTMLAALDFRYGDRINLKLFDVSSLFDDVFSNPSAYGIGDTTESCLDINTDSATAYVTSHKLRSRCTSSTVNQFMFWDNLHPSAAIHQVLGECVVKFLKDGSFALRDCRGVVQ